MVSQAYRAYRDALATRENIDEASEILFRELRSMAKGIVRITLRRHDPQLVQDIVAQAFMHLPEFREESNFGTWFWKLAHNKCLMDIRARKLRREVYIEDLYKNLVVPSSDAKQRLRELRTSLTPEDDRLVQLRLEGYGLAEIAEQFGVTYNEIFARWCRFRRKMQKLKETACESR